MAYPCAFFARPSLQLHLSSLLPFFPPALDPRPSTPDPRLRSRRRRIACAEWAPAAPPPLPCPPRLSSRPLAAVSDIRVRGCVPSPLPAVSVGPACECTERVRPERGRSSSSIVVVVVVGPEENSVVVCFPAASSATNSRSASRRLHARLLTCTSLPVQRGITFSSGCPDPFSGNWRIR